MCGIFGFVVDKKISNEPADYQNLLKELFKLSESRGKEAAGLACVLQNSITIYKQPLSASAMIKQPSYQEFLKNNLNTDGCFPLVAIGHARLVTNGLETEINNNQPVNKDGLVAVHNGIVTNDSELWMQFPNLHRIYEVDTEIILSLIKNFLDQNQSVVTAVKKTYQLLKGTASIALTFSQNNNLLLATNNGSLYFLQSLDRQKNIFIFASEKYILEQLLKRNEFIKHCGEFKITQLEARCGMLINFDNFKCIEFSLDQTDQQEVRDNNFFVTNKKIIDCSPTVSKTEVFVPTFFSPDEELNKYIANTEKVLLNLKRCTRCILPETFPFIEFDETGVCNYCHNYQPIKTKSIEELKNFLAPYRKKNSAVDCVVAFSGGRDSSYGLHYLKKVLDMHPVAYSYDWGMLTDLGRRNQARMTGKLGIEHIIVSADIRKKRSNIKKNVVAWLKKPDLGTVPLFMAGDKQFFYFANQVKKQMGVGLAVMCQNPLEKTYFKSGFCGVAPAHSNVNRQIYGLSGLKQVKQAWYYMRHFVTNLAFFNGSIADTLSAYAMYYLIPHNYLFLFEYLRWNEQEIESTLINEYEWETAPYSKSTWRIGDGTAPFYNYIYFMSAGFTENDTLRSNQIREGVLSREEALRRAREDNHPRQEAIKWYCDTIGVDFNQAMLKINSLPKLYKF